MLLPFIELGVFFPVVLILVMLRVLDTQLQILRQMPVTSFKSSH